MTQTHPNCTTILQTHQAGPCRSNATTSSEIESPIQPDLKPTPAVGYTTGGWSPPHTTIILNQMCMVVTLVSIWAVIGTGAKSQLEAEPLPQAEPIERTATGRPARKIQLPKRFEDHIPSSSFKLPMWASKSMPNAPPSNINQHEQNQVEATREETHSNTEPGPAHLGSQIGSQWFASLSHIDSTIVDSEAPQSSANICNRDPVITQPDRIGLFWRYPDQPSVIPDSVQVSNSLKSHATQLAAEKVPFVIENLKEPRNWDTLVSLFAQTLSKAFLTQNIPTRI